MDPMPVVAGDAHRAHDPPYEVNYGEVVRPVYERVERAERIRDALAAAGHPLVEPAAHGIGAGPGRARAGPGRVPGAGVAGLAGRRRPRGADPRLLPHPPAGQGRRPRPGRRRRPARLVLLRHRHPAGRRELHGRGGRRRRRPDRRRPGRRRGPGRLRPLPAARPPRRPRLLRRLLPAQQRRHRGQVAGTGWAGWRSWTSTSTTATAPRTCSGRTPRCCTCRCTATRPATTPTSPGPPTRPAAGPGRGATRNLPLPDGTGDDAYLAALARRWPGGRLRAGDPGRVGRLRHLRRTTRSAPSR